MTNIDLGDCENSLRQNYNLSNNETLYIKMLEVKQKGMRIPKIEYDIYTKYGGNLTKLNISFCQNDEISLLIPINNIDNNLDKLNKNSGYYNDFCYTATTESGTDITLKDRKNEFPSIAVCQDDCDFVDFNNTLKKAKCSCKAKESSSSFANMKINKNKLLDNFKNLKNIANLNLLKCVHVLFTKKGLSNNIGLFILISFILFHIITSFALCINQFDVLKNKIKDIIIAITKGKKNDVNNNKIIINNNIMNNNNINYNININNIKDNKKIQYKE